ncbi:MAG: UTP--glucose-1-phosphate uridylyltransferase [Oscillospiraceae bacterium]|nr:UTP--glucose-1-phosphate uridylyltransferase [Oscillospiraceae bacterium]
MDRTINPSVSAARELLRQHQQTDMLRWLDNLPTNEQETLATQIHKLDFSILHLSEAEKNRGKLEPMRSAVSISEAEANSERFTKIGLDALRAGKLGAVMLAGGHGSRLGFDHPKGMFNIGVNRTLYIFECLINNLMRVTKQAGVPVPLFIMTSIANNAETRSFFEAHQYFGYDPASVHFFPQEELPSTDPEGRLMLADRAAIATAPNGNGGWYASMARTGMLETVHAFGIEWLNVFAVDNVLQSIADPCFFGAVLEAGVVSGAKVVAKAEPEEKVGVLCLEDGRPSIVEYYEMTDEMRTLREPDGSLSYRFGVILNYLFSVESLDRTLAYDLPLHRAFKKLPYYNPSKGRVKPDAPNAFKFETLALDMVRLQDNCLAYEIDRHREFAPIKNATGTDSVESARALLLENGVVL